MSLLLERGFGDAQRPGPGSLAFRVDMDRRRTLDDSRPTVSRP